MYLLYRAAPFCFPPGEGGVYSSSLCLTYHTLVMYKYEVSFLCIISLGC